MMVTGSAPISMEVLEFMSVAICCPFYEGYGQTEGTGASFVTNKNDPIRGHVGGPLGCLEFKLVDVPEMEYKSTDRDTSGKA